MLNRFKWYRKWKGGYWVNTSRVSIYWVKMTKYNYEYWLKSWPSYADTHMEDWAND